MPGEIATYLLGAQGGLEDDFSRLYAATNPVLRRYLRVTTDADPAELTELTEHAWATALLQLKVCTPDDDAWLELVVGSAREAAAGLSGVGGALSTGTDSTSPDDLDHAIEALRACPPAQADVVAIGVIANLGREATSRLTGHEPAAVLALVQHGQERLAMSFDELIVALRAPARPDEVADLRLVAPLFAAALTRPVPTAAPPAAPIGVGAAWAEAFEASLSAPSAVEPLGIASLAQAPSSAFHLTAVGSPTGTPSRSAKAGVAATVWLVALGGMGTAAAMSGLLTAAIDGILGDHGRPPVITADGGRTPGLTPGPLGTPSAGGGSTAGNPQAEPSAGGGKQPGTSQPAGAGSTARGDGTQAVSLPGERAVVEIVLASYVVPDSSTPSTPTGTPITPAGPTTPTGPAEPAVPTSPTVPTTPQGPQTLVPQPGKGAGPAKPGHGSAHGSARAAAKAAKASARAAAKAAKAAAKADRKSSKAKSAKAAKAKSAKAHGHHKSTKAKSAKAAKAKSAKAAKAAKAKSAKAHGHHKSTRA